MEGQEWTTPFTIARYFDGEKKRLQNFDADEQAYILKGRKNPATLFVDPKEVESRDKQVESGGLPGVVTVMCRRSSGEEVHLFSIHGMRWLSDARVSVAWSASAGPLSGLGAEMVMEWGGSDWKFVERINSYIS